MLKPVTLQSSYSQEKHGIPTIGKKIVRVTPTLKINQNCMILLPRSAPNVF